MDKFLKIGASLLVAAGIGYAAQVAGKLVVPLVKKIPGLG